MIGKKAIETLAIGLLAGAAGGLAEVAWVTLYAGVVGGDPAVLARGVTTAAGVSALVPASPVVVGVAVHMTLSFALGVGLAFGWRALCERRQAATNPFPLVVVILAGIWAANFFVILPVVSPGFVHIVPYAVSLASKLLFAGAAGAVLARGAVAVLVSQTLARQPAVRP